jgi:hypothetical protein
LIIFDFDKLRGRIVEKYGSQAELCRQTGIFTPGALSEKLANRYHFTMAEIHALCAPDVLDIAAEDIGLYFYTPKFG